MQHVGNGSKYGLEVVYSVEPDGALETGGGVLQAMNLIDSDSFIVCNADVFHEYDFSQLFGVTSFLEERDDQAYLVLIENPSHNPDGDFCIDRDKIIPRPAGLPKRLDQVKSHKPHTYSGIGVYRKSFFIGLEQGRLEFNKLKSILRIIQEN